MRKTLLALTCLLCVVRAHAQDTQVTNMLQAPTSPTAQLLNFAPTIIEKPTDLPSLWLSLKNNTSDFSKLPNVYALDLSPAELFKNKYQTLVSLRDEPGTPYSRVFDQTFLVSLGLKQFTDTVTKQSYFKTGLGLKFSLARPDWDAATTLAKFNQLKAMQDSLTDMFTIADQQAKNDPQIVAIQRVRDSLAQIIYNSPPNTPADVIKNAQLLFNAVDAMYGNLYQTLFQKFSESLGSGIKTRIKNAASQFVINRRGWSLDFAGGFTASFPNNTFGYSIADKTGAWLTGGYNTPRTAFLGIVRYLYQPDSIFADPKGKFPTTKVSTLDGGASFNYNSSDKRFNLAMEGVYRSVLGKTMLSPSWHIVFSASYNFADNKLLSFSIGRDFNGQVETGGDLIAGLNLILGFGGPRTL